MKRLIVFLILNLFFIPPGYSYYLRDEVMEKEMTICETLNRIESELGAEVSYIEYREPGVMREKGMLYGIAGSFTARKLSLFSDEVDNWMLRLEARFAWGKMDYKNSGTMENIPDYLIEARAIMGYDFPLLVNTIFTPYFGFGYRYLNDDSGGKISSTGAYGYERESNYFYSPLGFETNTSLKKGLWSWGIKAEYDIFWQGRQISHLSDVDPGYSDVKNKQKRGYGLRGALRIKKENDTQRKVNYCFGDSIFNSFGCFFGSYIFRHKWIFCCKQDSSLSRASRNN